MLLRLVVLSGLLSSLLPGIAAGQGLTGALIGTVKDQQGGVIRGATVLVSSDALIGGPASQTTNERGQLRFLTLPPGVYTVEVRFANFETYREEGIAIGSGATIDRPIVLTPAGLATSVTVDGSGSRLDARDPGFGTRFGSEDLRAIPTRRSSMFDFLRNAPGVSPTSPSSGTVTTIAAFGSGTNENQFLIDGTNTTCPCNGVARSEPGVDFIQEVQVQAVGASAEFGNVQGAVINVITRQGSDHVAADTSYYGQPPALTSQPVLLADGTGHVTGYERLRYRDFTANTGGPLIRGRAWIFGGYQYLRDYDSQPGTDPAYPRTYEQNKFFAKATWQLAPGWQLMQSFHEEVWVSPDQPTWDKPFETTLRNHAHVPAMTLGHLTHGGSRNTVWDVRVGRFRYNLDSPPATGDTSTAPHLDAPTGVVSKAPLAFNSLTLIRTTAKATINHYRSGLWHADHAFKAGTQIEKGEHWAPVVIPTGVRYIDRNGAPLAATYGDPAVSGGVFVTAALFATDAITFGDRLTVDAGLRYDHSRAISQDLPGADLAGNETSTVVKGAGTLFTWNIVSPRLGLTYKLTADGRTMLRASYGRFAQGVLTGEIGAFHPGAPVWTTKAYVPADGDYTLVTQVITPANLRLDPDIRAPRTDEYSAGIDRQLGRSFQMAAAYVHKSGANFIGWEDVGGIYATETRTLADGRSIVVYNRQNAPADQRFLLTNPDGYSMRYDGLVLAAEKRRSQGWQAFGSLTYSRAIGLQAGSGTTAAGAQVSTVAPPPGPTGLNFGRDPNDLTFAYGRLANDRPWIARAMSSVDVPRTGLVFAANIQYFTGKPWAAAAQVPLAQNPAGQRVLIEPRGTRRLSSQTLLDLRLSRSFAIGRASKIDLFFDVLNALNSTAEESIANDVQMTTTAFTPNFALPNAFVDPRRVMLGARVNLGR